jgi:hypothetical protein
MQKSSPLASQLCVLIFMNPAFCFVGSYLAMFVLIMY